MEQRRVNRTHNSTWESLNIRSHMAERKVSGLAYVAFFLGFCGLLCTMVAFSTPGWGTTREISRSTDVEGEIYGYYNIWYICWRLVSGEGITSCSLTTAVNTTVPSWWSACQVMAIFMILGAFFSQFTMGAYICSKALNLNPWLVGTAAGLALLAGLTGTVWFIIWCAQFIMNGYWCCEDTDYLEYDLNYSCYTCGVAVVLLIASSIVCTLEMLYVRRIRSRNMMYLYETGSSYKY